MNLTVRFRSLRFPESVVRRAIAAIDAMPDVKAPGRYWALSLENEDERWELEHVEDFFAGYIAADSSSLHYSVEFKSGRVAQLMWIHIPTAQRLPWAPRKEMTSMRSSTSLGAHGMSRFHRPEQLIQNRKSSCENPVKFGIFIGHGRSEDWRLLSNHLRDLHGLDVVSFENGARAGHHIREFLTRCSTTVSSRSWSIPEKTRLRMRKCEAVKTLCMRPGFFKAGWDFPKR